MSGLGAMGIERKGSGKRWKVGNRLGKLEVGGRVSKEWSHRCVEPYSTDVLPREPLTLSTCYIGIWCSSPEMTTTNHKF